MTFEDLHKVEIAAAALEAAPAAPEAALADLETAVATAIVHGESIKAVAQAARTTPLAVLDAAEAVGAGNPSLELSG